MERGYLCTLSNHDIEETRPLFSGPAWCFMQLALILPLSSTGGLLVLGKGLKGCMLMCKRPSTSAHVRVESFCCQADGNGLDFEPMLT